MSLIENEVGQWGAEVPMIKHIFHGRTKIDELLANTRKYTFIGEFWQIKFQLQLKIDSLIRIFRYLAFLRLFSCLFGKLNINGLNFNYNMEL